jgi:hypothetical protein
LQIQSRVAAKESRFGKRDSIAPPGTYGFFTRFPRLSPWAIIFRHSVAGFMVHFKKMICAFVSTVKDFQFAIGEFIGYL